MCSERILIGVPLFSFWMFVWLCFFGCNRQVVTAVEQQQRDSVETRVLSVSEIEGTVPLVGQVLEVPHLRFRMKRVSDSVVVLQTPVRYDVEQYVRYVSQKQVFKNAFNQNSNNDNDTKVKSREVSKLKDKSQNAPRKVKQVSKQVEKSVSKQKNTFPWWILILIAVFIILRVAAKFALKKHPGWSIWKLLFPGKSGD